MASPKSKAASRAEGAISAAPFGKVDGRDVALYTLRNETGALLRMTTYGAIVTELHLPDRNGNVRDIVLGFENLEGYLGKSPYFGATVGRVGNRIRDSKFTLSGKEYAVAANDGPHHLHGGPKGWDKLVWNAETSETADGPSLRFTHVSKDGEEGYPGTVRAEAVYTLTHANELWVEMTATTDRTTLVNMLHHTYWNLGGFDSGPVTGHELTLNADHYTPGDPTVPTGVTKPVAGTPFDFTKGKPIGKDLQGAGGNPVGFDHNFVVNGEPDAMRFVARLKDPRSGRVMTIEADQPGVQFYSGNYLDGSLHGKGAVFEKHGGLCLETQKFPNAINVPAWAKDVILEPGTTYRHTMIHRFTCE
jgi:aldose 1-epimerase